MTTEPDPPLTDTEQRLRDTLTAIYAGLPDEVVTELDLFSQVEAPVKTMPPVWEGPADEDGPLWFCVVVHGRPIAAVSRKWLTRGELP